MSRPARRARPIIRDDLVMRYARVRGLTFGGAWDIAEPMSDAQLRDVVEELEAEWTGGRSSDCDCDLGPDGWQPHRPLCSTSDEKWTGGLTR